MLRFARTNLSTRARHQRHDHFALALLVAGGTFKVMRFLLFVLFMTGAACEPCRPEPCPYPGWDPNTCSCRSEMLPSPEDATIGAMDAISDQGGEDAGMEHKD